MIAVRPFSIHPNRSTEVKVRMIIDNFRIDLCPFNIMALIRNAFLNSIIYQIVNSINPKPQRSKNRRFNNSCVF